MVEPGSTSRPEPVAPRTPPEGDAEQTVLSFQLARIDQRLNETLEALRAQSGRLQTIEKHLGIDGGPPGTTPAWDHWEDAVRRACAGIDMRLDYLEQEQEGLQEEEGRLRDLERARVEGSMGRLERRFLAGQLILGVLMVTLLIAHWREGEQSADPGSQSLVTTAQSPASRPVTRAASPEHRPPPVAQTSQTGISGDILRPTQGGAEQHTSAHRDIAQREASAVRNAHLPSPGSVAARSITNPTGESQGDTAPEQVKATATRPANAPGKSEPTTPPDQARGTKHPESPSQDLPSTEPTPKPAAQFRSDQAVETDAPPATPGKEILLAEKGYSVQLIGFQSKSSIRPFADKFGIKDKARYMRSRARDRDWYAVLIGVYGTRAEATAAAGSLPEGLRKLDPFVRSLPEGAHLIPID